MSKRPDTRQTKAGRKIIEGLEALVETLEKGERVEARFTVRTVELPDPGQYDAAGVKRTRELVSASQAVFARLLGVSAVLVRSWEHGDRTPAPWGRRLLDEVNRDPVRWAAMITATPTAAAPDPNEYTDPTRRQRRTAAARK